MKEQKKDKISLKKLKKYFTISEKALKEINKKIKKGKEKYAKEIIEMASNYISDARYFQKRDDIVNAFAALNYAHGWIDSGARLGIFNVRDNKLFTIK